MIFCRQGARGWLGEGKTARGRERESGRGREGDEMTDRHRQRYIGKKHKNEDIEGENKAKNKETQDIQTRTLAKDTNTLTYIHPDI